jgi:predicted transcriptional regulator
LKYRSKLETTFVILKVALGGNATKTRLMYGSLLSFAQINDYLKFLASNALVVRDEDEGTYALTAKGMQFLRKYEELEKLIPVDRLLAAFP